MTNLTLRSGDIPSIFRDIHKFGVGFDPLFDRLINQQMNAQHSHNYPPYNIVKQSDDAFYIEVAVAGFSDGEIDVQLEKRVLTVKGSRIRDEDATVEYLHRGISSRDFTREFTLAEHVEVKNALVKDGILTIYLERIVPDEQKPKKIAIVYDK